MSDTEISTIDKLIEVFKPKRCLEYGCGYSTLYYSRHKCIENWISIENNFEWATNISKESVKLGRSSVEVHFLDFPEYITYPKGKFDFILVDGRQRMNCLKYVKDNDLLNDCGVALLHDSVREYYKEADLLFQNKVLVEGNFSQECPQGFNGLKIYFKK